MQGISRVAKELLASEQGHFPMESGARHFNLLDSAVYYKFSLNFCWSFKRECTLVSCNIELCLIIVLLLTTLYYNFP
jgi:hypothetical protein